MPLEQTLTSASGAPRGSTIEACRGWHSGVEAPECFRDSSAVRGKWAC